MNENKDLARAFRTTIPSKSDVSDVLILDDSEDKPKKHTVTFNYPPDEETLNKIKYLRRYKSFIHEAIIFSTRESSVKDIYDSLIPKGSKVQFIEIEYKDGVSISTVNIEKLNVDSVHIKLETIGEDDIHRCMSAVKSRVDFGIKLSGWHEFDKKYLNFVDETTGESIGILNYDMGKSHVVFWSEEKY